MTKSDPTTPDSDLEVAVPIFGTWRRAYAFIVLLFLAQVVVFSILTSNVS